MTFGEEKNKVQLVFSASKATQFLLHCFVFVILFNSHWGIMIIKKYNSCSFYYTLYCMYTLNNRKRSFETYDIPCLVILLIRIHRSRFIHQSFLPTFRLTEKNEIVPHKILCTTVYVFEVIWVKYRDKV